MKSRVHGFDWDEGNRNKCTKHGLSIPMIEDFFQGNIQIIGDPQHSQSENRFIAVGKVPNGRPIFVGFTYRKKGKLVLIRPISARYMHEKEATKYGKTYS